MAKVISWSVNGIVKIEDDAGRIRLRWSVLGERYCFALGLPVSQASRAFASQKANRIEGDIQSGHFDKSLKSYKPERGMQCRDTTQGLLDAFWKERGKRLKGLSRGNYHNAVLKLQAWSGSDPLIQSIGKDEVELFCEWLSRQGLAPTTSEPDDRHETDGKTYLLQQSH